MLFGKDDYTAYQFGMGKEFEDISSELYEKRERLIRKVI